MKDNWSTHPLLTTPAFSSIMSVDRYLFIDSSIHFSYDHERTDTDKMWKLRAVINLFNESFGESFDIGQDISIDESLLLWRGHHSMIRYVPNKAAR
jgi:hypothetical protein